MFESFFQIGVPLALLAGAAVLGHFLWNSPLLNLLPTGEVTPVEQLVAREDALRRAEQHDEQAELAVRRDILERDIRAQPVAGEVGDHDEDRERDHQEYTSHVPNGERGLDAEHVEEPHTG